MESVALDYCRVASISKQIETNDSVVFDIQP